MFFLAKSYEIMEICGRISWKLINGGVQKKVQGGVNIFQKLINGPPLLFWTQEYEISNYSPRAEGDKSSMLIMFRYM